MRLTVEPVDWVKQSVPQPIKNQNRTKLLSNREIHRPE